VAKIVAELMHLEQGKHLGSGWGNAEVGPRITQIKGYYRQSQGNNSEIVAVVIILQGQEQQVEGQKQ
jgi:hypothetical protein